jgi:riboflavin kinase/FMN adenylyltransferase
VSVVDDFEGWPRGPIHLAIGAFDGVHRGHQELVRRLRADARASGASAVAATFDPLPIQVLAPGAPPSALSDAVERATLLAGAGADAIVVFHYDRAFAAISAREFVDRVRGAGDVRRIVVGPDFRFGHGRAGDVALLTELGRAHAFDVDVVAPVEIGGAVVSSTRIRNLLLAGDVATAGELLGRPYAVRGRIVPGDQRGRALGFPTIEVATPPERLLPRDGIYATWITARGRVPPGGERVPPGGKEDRPRAAATSVGARPIDGGGRRVIESYLIDPGDLHAEQAETAFVRRLRDELRFESGEELAARIARDVEEARAALFPR